MRAVAAVVCVAAIVSMLAVAGGGASGAEPSGAPAPVLGQPWGPNQRGYGESHPQAIFNGGDPTGLVTHIHWRHWGSKRAVGVGTSIFVWPGLSVAKGLRARAKVVAFHLGSCNEVPSYDAVEWFFPKYRQRFHPRSYLNPCSGRGHGYSWKPRHCGRVRLGRYVTAVDITASDLRCRSAQRLIAGARSPIERTMFAGGRFVHRQYYCGTEGWGEIGPPVLFDCGLDRRDISFEVYPPAD